MPFPDLNGTWQGQLQTTWETLEPIHVILTIKQSFTRISCVMRSAEMTSRSYLAGFWIDDDEQLRMLGYFYISKPSTSAAHRSQQHDGTIIFEIIGNPAVKLKGTYWTDRKSTGEVTLEFMKKERQDEYPKHSGKHPMNKSQ